MRLRRRSLVRVLYTSALLIPLLAGCESDPASTKADATGLDPVERLALEEDGSEAAAKTTRSPAESKADAAAANAEQLRAQADADVDAWLDLGAGGNDQAARTARRLDRLTAPRDPAPAPEPEPVAVAADPVPAEPVLGRDPAPPVIVTPPPPPPAPSAVETQLRALRNVMAERTAEDDDLLLATARALLARNGPLPDTLTDLTDDERHGIESFRPFFVQYAGSAGDDAAAVRRLEAAIEALAPSAIAEPIPQLRLPRAALCWRVQGFGAFDAFRPYAWLAGHATKIILYLELDDFESRTDPDGAFVTTLSQKLEIYAAADGALVWAEDWQRARDVTRQRRRDFFTTQLVELPAALSVGDYHLKIRARDETNGAEAETSVPFRMVADARLAGKRE